MTNMSCTVLPEILCNVPLLSLNNPQPFEGRMICLHLQVEQGKEELTVVSPCFLTLKRWIISNIFVTVLTSSLSHSFKFELSIFLAANDDTSEFHSVIH